MALLNLSGLSEFLDGDRTLLALIPALSVGYLHFQTNYVPFEKMYIFVGLSAIIAGVSNNTKLLTSNFDIRYEQFAKYIVLAPLFIISLSLHGYAIWKMYKYGGGSRSYIIIFTVQILATTMFVSDMVLVLLVRAISMIFRLLIFLISLALFVVFGLGDRIAERISLF